MPSKPCIMLPMPGISVFISIVRVLKMFMASMSARRPAPGISIVAFIRADLCDFQLSPPTAFPYFAISSFASGSACAPALVATKDKARAAAAQPRRRTRTFIS